MVRLVKVGFAKYSSRSKEGEIPSPKQKTNKKIGIFVDYFSSLSFSSVAQSCPTLCDPMNRSTPGLPVHHKPPESAQTHVH